MEPNKVAEEGKTQQEFDGVAESVNMPLPLDDLDAVAGGAGDAGGVEIDGQIAGLAQNGIFPVQLDNGSSAMCRVSGHLRMNSVRINPGDRVRVETRSDNPSKGRIIQRYR